MVIIAIEGIDRIGKTSLSIKLAEWLGWKYQKFPNYELDSGERILWMLQGLEVLDPEYYQELQNRNKLETLEFLSEGNYVFDRYKLSEVVYGLVNGLPEKWVRELAAKLPEPDVTIILHGEPFETDDSVFKDSELQKEISEKYLKEWKDSNEYELFNVNDKCKGELLEDALFLLEERGLI